MRAPALDSESDPIDAFLADGSPSVAEVARAARALVRDLFPDAHERLITGWGAVSYSHGAAGAGAFALLGPVKDAVHLHLWNARLIDDRDGLLRGEGTWTRHVRLRSLDDLAHPGVARLVVVAAHIADPGTGFADAPAPRRRSGRAATPDADAFPTASLPSEAEALG